MKYLRAATFAALTLAAPAATATTSVTQWGVSALTAYADCSLVGCDASGLGFNIWLPTKHTESGGLNQTFASQIDVPQVHETALSGTVDMGLASAQAQLDNANLSVPVLKARAESYSFEGWVCPVSPSVSRAISTQARRRQRCPSTPR